MNTIRQTRLIDFLIVDLAKNPIRVSTLIIIILKKRPYICKKKQKKKQGN